MRALLACVLALCACQTATTSGDELSDAKTQVQRLFDGIKSGDCATLGSLVPAAKGSECAEFLKDWRDDLKIQLVEITRVERDGRDKRAIIVTTTVNRRGEQKAMLIRATHEKGAWQLAL